MNEAPSPRARDITLSAVGSIVVGAIVVGSTGCAPSYPIVTDSTEPWQEELAREREAHNRGESGVPSSSIARQTRDTGENQDKQKHNAFVVAVTDVIAFPFRGAGWIARQMF